MDQLLGGSEPPQAPEGWMKRYFKVILVSIATIVALLLTISRQSPDGSLGITSPRPSRAETQREAKEYDLGALKIFRIVLGRVTDSYVEPERIKPKQMLLSALDAIEKQVAEVLVDESADKEKVKVRVEDVEREFHLKDIDSPWSLSATVKGILRFIQPHLHADTEIRDVEYAAINGMLDSLDPHSVLLQPEFYNEMRLSTRGHFGGLGIVISMPNGRLTVMKPIKKTPADIAGLKACDEILKIGEESTINMTLQQAVKRLRGVPGSKVILTVNRVGWKRPVKKTLTRAIIKVDSVKSRMLKKKIGYISLSSFQGNSYDDIKEHLAKLKQKGLKGLILDLRGNPGGLLDQAIKISDLFIDSGTLLTTVSHAGKRREEKRAHKDGTEPRYPIAVLVSSGSASASEIVAGALKNLDRGVIIGSRTFGKGSVQVLYNNDDGSALKLTIAQYLTPGDVSIQTVGITPDIATDPVMIKKDFVHLKHSASGLREKDLAKHLTHKNAHATVKPLERLRYLAQVRKLSATDKKRIKEREKNLCLYPDRRCKPDQDEDKFRVSFQIRLARDLLASTTSWRKTKILAGANELIKKIRAEEDKKIETALKKVGIDWSLSNKEKSSNLPKLNVRVSTNPSGGKAIACKKTRVVVRVKNEGSEPIYRLRAMTQSTNNILSDRELIFGKIGAGQEKRWHFDMRLRDALTRVDEVTLKFSDAAKQQFEPHHFRISVKGAPRPVFAYSYQLIDDIEGNGDGKAQRGEKARLLVRVKNIGKGPAFKAITSLKNLSGVGIFIRKGRSDLGRIDPGQSKTASLSFDVQPGFRPDTFKVELSVIDQGLREYVTEKLNLPIAKTGDGPALDKGFIKAKKDLSFYSWADANAPIIGQGEKKAVFKVVGKIGEWYKVLAEEGRFAFVKEQDIEKLDRAKVKSGFHCRLQVTPPTIQLNVPTYATKASKLTISGKAVDDTKIQDFYVFVRNTKAKIDGRKIYYRSNRKSKTPRELGFSVDVPLWDGANYVTFFARESNNTQTQETVVILKKKDHQAVKVSKR